MEISRDAYRAIEDIVGADYVTDDPAFLDSYAFQWLAELVRPNRSHYMPRPWAVVMPASTREVQAVTKVCNKYRIKIKPISTGWYHWAAPMKDDEPTVQFDLRRMNRILDIDEKNRFAVVEPYVICAQLQAEAIGAREGYPKFSEWTAGERIEEAESTGADALVTACPWCERNFIDAVRGSGNGPRTGSLRRARAGRDMALSRGRIR